MTGARSLFEDFAALKAGTFAIGDEVLSIREPSAADVHFAQGEEGKMFDARLVARCLIGPDGNRLYTDKDAERIHLMAPGPVGQVALAIMKLSGRLTTGTEENPSPETAGATSPSVSASNSASPTPTA